MTGQQIDRDRLRELAENATPGPWRFDRDQRDGWMVVFGGNEYPHGYNIIGSNEYLEPADAEFIAAARNALPALLDENAELRVSLAQAEAALRQIPGYTAPEHFRSAVEKLIAEKLRAEACIQAVRDVLDRAEAAINRHPAYTWSGQRMDPIVNGADIRRALDGER